MVVGESAGTRSTESLLGFTVLASLRSGRSSGSRLGRFSVPVDDSAQFVVLRERCIRNTKVSEKIASQQMQEVRFE